MEIKPGSYGQLTSLLMESKALWGVGFTMDDYLTYNLRLRKHPWSRDHFRHLVLVDKVKQTRAGIKVFELEGVADRRPLRIAQLSELFVPPGQRGRGFSKALMEQLMSQLTEEGYDLAILYSQIQNSFFNPFGFKEIEKYDLTFDLVIPTQPRRKVEVCRHKTPEAVRALHQKQRPAAFAITRSPEFWELLRYKRALFNRLQWDQGRESLYMCEDGSAYAWTLWTGQRLEIKDTAYKSPDALADVFAHVLQRHGPGILSHAFGWLPRSFERLPFVKNADFTLRRTAVLMAADLTGQNNKILRMKPYDLQIWALDRIG